MIVGLVLDDAKLNKVNLSEHSKGPGTKYVAL